MQVAPEVATYIVDIARATRKSPSLSLGVSPRGATALLRAARAWAWLAGRDFVTPDDVKALAQATLVHRLGLRPEAELEGVDVGPGAGVGPRLGPGPSLTTSTDHMVISGRVPLLLLLGSVRCVLRPSGAAPCALWLLGVAPRWLAVRPAARAEPAGLRLHRRRRARSVRLGDPAERRCSSPTTRAARCGLQVRDAWQPSAGATRQPPPVPLPPASAAPCHPLLPRRRGDLRADGVTSAPGARCGLAARQRTYDVPGAVRALPPFESRKHLPSRLARLRELDGRAAVRVRGQGTEFDSLREYVRGDDVRSIDWRASARTPHVVVRTWQPERDRRVVMVLDTSRTAGGPGRRRRRRPPPRRGDGRRAAPGLAGRPRRRPDRLRRRRPSGPGPATRAGARDIAARLQETMADLDPVLAEADWDALAGAVQEFGRQRALVVLLTPLEPSAIAESLLPVLPGADPPPPGGARLGARPGARPAGRRRAHRRRGVRRRGRRAGARAAAPGSPTCCAGSGSTSSTPTPSSCRRCWPTTTWP